MEKKKLSNEELMQKLFEKIESLEAKIEKQNKELELTKSKQKVTLTSLKSGETYELSREGLDILNKAVDLVIEYGKQKLP